MFLILWALGARPLTTGMALTFAVFLALLGLCLAYVYHARVLDAVTE